jgi:hypothetical protein
VVQLDPSTGDVIKVLKDITGYGNLELDGMCYDPYTGNIFTGSFTPVTGTGSTNDNLFEINRVTGALVAEFKVPVTGSYPGVDGIHSDGLGNIWIAGFHDAYFKLALSSSAGTSGTVSLVKAAPELDDVVPITGTGSPNTYTGNAEATNTVVCFMRGTHILTESGEVTVESLKPGDLVVTRDRTLKPVTWIGWRRIGVAGHPRPETVAPIRIERGAFAENVPHRDLVVSPDHAIFADGKLICARQLVNGTTIRQLDDVRSVEYFHVELDQHAILFAEGLTAESYLDTGNRGFFANGGAPLVLHPDLTDESDCPAREAASCAPFVFDDAGVRPVWERLAERAAELGQPVPAVETVTDPGVRVVAGGQTIRPIRTAGVDGFRFVLPKGATEVRLMSNATAPTVVTPWQEDRRRLGLYVERIVLHSGLAVSEIPVDHPSLTDGWWDVEGTGRSLRRWTNGAAVLPLPDTDAPIILEIRAATNGVSHPVASEPTGATAVETQRVAA